MLSPLPDTNFEMSNKMLAKENKFRKINSITH